VASKSSFTITFTIAASVRASSDVSDWASRPLADFAALTVELGDSGVAVNFEAFALVDADAGEAVSGVASASSATTVIALRRVDLAMWSFLHVSGTAPNRRPNDETVVRISRPLEHPFRIVASSARTVRKLSTYRGWIPPVVRSLQVGDVLSHAFDQEFVKAPRGCQPDSAARSNTLL
jgi:hypothetical protein